MRQSLLSIVLVFVLIGQVCAQSISILTEDYAPFNYQENGEIKGITTSLVRELLEITQIPLKNKRIEILPWKRAYNITLKEPNTLLYTTTRIPEREKLFKWVGPIFPREQWLYQRTNRKDIRVEKHSDLNQYYIAVTNGSANEQLLAARENFPEEMLIRTRRTENKIGMLLADRVDLIPLHPAEYKNLLDKSIIGNGDLKKVFLLSKQYDYYLAFSLETPNHIVQKFQRALDEMKRDGRFQAKYAM